MKKIIAAFVTMVWVFTISCAPATSSRYREGDNRGQQTNITVADEERLTQEALPKMMKDYPPSNSAELQKYISYLGMKIVTANNLEGNPYHYEFTVVDVKKRQCVRHAGGEGVRDGPAHRHGLERGGAGRGRRP